MADSTLPKRSQIDCAPGTHTSAAAPPLRDVVQRRLQEHAIAGRALKATDHLPNGDTGDGAGMQANAAEFGPDDSEAIVHQPHVQDEPSTRALRPRSLPSPCSCARWLLL